jgi:hypothetical protein
LAVDKDGNPAFISVKSMIYWKENGKWRKMKGCAKGVTFGGDGSFYKLDCDSFIYKYAHSKKTWKSLGFQKATSLSTTDSGVLWILNDGKTYSLDSLSKKWIEKGENLKEAS